MTINATWLPPNLSLQNGIITSYVLQYKLFTDVSANVTTACNHGSDYFTVSVASTAWFANRTGSYGYIIRVAAATSAGIGPFTDCTVVAPLTRPLSPPSTGNIITIAAVSAGGVVVLITCIVLVLLLLRRKARRQVRSLMYTPETLAYMAQLKPLEIDRERVSILTELGEGQFGKVFEASATGMPEHKGRAMTVAVKYLNDDHMEEQHTFIEEAVRMSRLKHARIVQLLAVCFESAPFFIVLEHMSNGDLKGFLAKHKHAFDGSRRKIDVRVMVRMCCEVASALAYMSEAKYVHRDIAARNVLVAADESLKLGDFGLSRGVYTTEYYRNQGGGMLPLRFELSPC